MASSLMACGGGAPSAPKTPDELVALTLKALAEGKRETLKPAMGTKPDFEEALAKAGQPATAAEIDQGLAELDRKAPLVFGENLELAKAAGFDFAAAKVGPLQVTNHGPEIRVEAPLTAGTREGVLRLGCAQVARGLVLFEHPRFEMKQHHSACEGHACPPDRACDDASGAPACVCKPGQQDNDKDGSCAPDCATAALACQPNAACRDALGTAVCRCVDGFQDHDGDGSCTADCAGLKTPCGANAACEDTSGTAACICNYGFQDRDANGTCEPGHRVGKFDAVVPDPTDTTALGIIQTQPGNNASTQHPMLPIIVFFDDQIDPATISEVGFEVFDTKANAPVYGLVSGERSSAGNTIMKFTRAGGLPAGTTIRVKLSYVGGIKDNNGNALGADYQFEFATGVAPTATVDLGFEAGELGAWLRNGDAAVLSSPQGELVAPQGKFVAALSTGHNDQYDYGPVLGGSAAVASKYSEIASAPIPVPAGAEELVFDYDFSSQEFDQYVGGKFDDEFHLTIAGSDHSIPLKVTTVNTVGVDGSVPTKHPQGADGAYQHTGWKTLRVNLQGLSGQIVFAALVADVGDSAYSSIVWIDNLRFE